MNFIASRQISELLQQIFFQIMSRQQQQRRSKQSLQAYSPEYSSPYSTDSMLQARFSKASSFKGFPQDYQSAAAGKENLTQEFLPIFQEVNNNNTSTEHMIPQVTLASIEENINGQIGGGGGGKLILSDVSDELLIKQLQLNLDDRLGTDGRKPIPTNKTNQSSKVRYSKAQCQSLPNSDPKIEYAPEPYPQPVPPVPQQIGMSIITDTFDASQTMTTNQKQTSPAILSQEEQLNLEPDAQQWKQYQLLPTAQRDEYQMFINTDSSRKQQLQDATCHLSWASPITGRELNQQQDRVIVHEFVENSIIEEQPTEEQLATMLTCSRQNQTGSQQNYNASQPSAHQEQPVCEVQKGPPAPKIVEQSGEESLEQIRLINQVIRPKTASEANNANNQSPFKQDASGSLKDFSLGTPAATAEPELTALNNNFNHERALTDIENSYKNRTVQMTHYIRANLQTTPDSGNPALKAKKTGQRADSTLLDAVVENQNQRTAQNQQQQHHNIGLGQTRQQLQAAGGKSPTKQPRAVVYGQFQATLDGLLQPVLKNTGVTASKKPIQSNQQELAFGSKVTAKRPIIGVSQFAAPNVTQITPPKVVNQAREAASATIQQPDRQSSNNQQRINCVQPIARQSIGSTCKPSSTVPIAQKYSTANQGPQETRTPLGTAPATLKELNSSPIPALGSNVQQSSLNYAQARDRFMKNAKILSQDVKNQSQMGCIQPTNIQLKPQTQQPLPQPKPYSRSILSNQSSPTTQPLGRTALSNKSSSVSQPAKAQTQVSSNQAFSRLNQNQSSATNASIRPNKPNQFSIITTIASASLIKKSATPSMRSPKPISPRRLSTNTMNTNTNNVMTDQVSRRRFAAFEGALLQQQRSKERLHSQNRSQTPTKTVTQTPTKASAYQLRRVVECLKLLDISTFLEIERIKKPSAAVSAIARMSCTFFETVRSRDAIVMEQVQTMTSWSQIQEYMRTQLTCCVPELRTLLKQKVQALGRLELDGEVTTALDPEILPLLEKLNQTYFTGEKIRVVRRFIQSSKPMRALVHLIYAFVCLALNLEREFKVDNLLGVSDTIPTSKNDEQFLKAAFAPQQQQQQQATQQQLASTSKSNRSVKSNSIARKARRSRDHVSKQESCDDNSNISAKSRKQQSFILIDQNQSHSYCSKCSSHLMRDSSSMRNSIISNNQVTSQSMHSSNNNKQLLISHQHKPSSRQSVKSPKAAVAAEAAVIGIAATNPPIYLEQNQYEQYEQQQQQELQASGVKMRSSLPSRNINNYFTTASAVCDNNADQQLRQSQKLLPSTQKLSSQRQAKGGTLDVEDENMVANMTSLRAFSPLTMTMTIPNQGAMMTISQAQQQQAYSQNGCSNSNDGGSTTPSTTGGYWRATAGSRTQVVGFLDTQKTQQNPSQQQAANYMKEKRMGTKRKSAVSIGSDFASVVRANANVTTPQRCFEFNQQSTALTSRPQLKAKPQSQQKHISSNTGQQKSTVRRQMQQQSTAAKSKSPVTLSRAATNQASKLTKVPSSKTTISQKRVSTIPAQSSGGAQIRHHQRTSTLYKTTASTQAKLIKQESTSKRPNSSSKTRLARAVSAKAITPQPAPEPSQRKTMRKSKQSATSKSGKSSNVRQMTIQLPNFGGIESQQLYAHENNAEDVGRLSQNSAFIGHHDENSHQPLRNKTKHIARGSQQFDSSVKNKQLQIQSQSTLLQTREQSPSNNRYFIDSLDEQPSQAKDCRRPQEDRASFILQQAQAITENINSCYKTHNLPQIDMATIEKLKMRRIKFMRDQVVGGGDADSDSNCELLAAKQPSASPDENNNQTYHSSKQSCNVLTTMTVETQQTVEVDKNLDHDGGGKQKQQQETSFTEALNKLKAEVESLMQQRINNK